MRKKILVRGPALSMSGYGEQTRFALRCLRAYEELFDIYLIPVGWGKTGWIWESSEERQWIDQIVNKTLQYNQAGTPYYDMSLQVTIPNEWEKIASVDVEPCILPVPACLPVDKSAISVHVVPFQNSVVAKVPGSPP